MTDQSPPADASPTAGQTAKKLADQTIDTAGSLVDLAVALPVETAKLTLSTLKKLVTKLEEVLPDGAKDDD